VVAKWLITFLTTKVARVLAKACTKNIQKRAGWHIRMSKTYRIIQCQNMYIYICLCVHCAPAHFLCIYIYIWYPHLSMIKDGPNDRSETYTYAFKSYRLDPRCVIFSTFIYILLCNYIYILYTNSRYHYLRNFVCTYIHVYTKLDTHTYIYLFIYLSRKSTGPFCPL
jgi:hypothetical protein